MADLELHSVHHKTYGYLKKRSKLKIQRYSFYWKSITFCCCSVAKSYPTLCDPMDCSTPDSSVLHYHKEFAQIHVHWVSMLSNLLILCHPFSFCIQSFPVFSNHLCTTKTVLNRPQSRTICTVVLEKLLVYHWQVLSSIWKWVPHRTEMAGLGLSMLSASGISLLFLP